MAAVVEFFVAADIVDYIWSNEMLGAGHTYFIRLNDDPGYPQIEEKLSEVHSEHSLESDDGTE